MHGQTLDMVVWFVGAFLIFGLPHQTERLKLFVEE